MSEELNFDDEIIKLLDTDPFHPFSLVLSSGDRYEVTDPHRVAMGMNVVILVHPRSGVLFLRKTQIVAVDVPEAAA